MRQTRYGAFLLAVSLCTGCADLTRPPRERIHSTPGAIGNPPPAAPPAPTQPALDLVPPTVAPGTIPAATAPSVVADQIGASHILVAYQGATRAKPTVTRSKQEARELAAKIADESRKPGTDFAKLAQSVSDGPSGIEGGALPRFGRRQMVKPFADAAFSLQPGEISGVVETNFGFHIIKRTD